MISSLSTSPSKTSLVQFYALCQRNLLIKRRNLRKSLVEILSSYYYLVLLAIVCYFLQDKHYDALTSIHDGSEVSLASNEALLDIIHVAPNISEVEQIMDEIVIHNRPLDINYQIHQSEDDIIYHHLNHENISVAVIFSENPLVNSTYKIRLNTKEFLLPGTKTLMTPNNNCRKTERLKLESGLTCLPNRYFHSGFLTLQVSIDSAITKLRTGSMVMTKDLFLRSLPRYAATDSWTTLLRYFVPLSMVPAWMSYFLYVLILLVDEKEKKVTEAMKVMGLSSSLYWFSWLLYYSVVLLILSITFPLILVKIGLFRKGSLLLLFVLLFLAGISMVSMGLMIAPMFSTTKTAGAVGNVLFLGAYLLTLAQKSVASSNVEGLSWILSLISPYAFTVGLDQALILENTDGGVSWQNIWEGQNISFGGVLIMLCIDIGLYLAIGIYLEYITSGEQNIRHKFYLLCQPSYWFSSSPNSSQREILMDDLPEDENMESMNTRSTGDAAIRFRQLNKSFKLKKEKVDVIKDFNLDIYEDEITAVLGHNGAGKTTLFNIITGVLAPSNGTVKVFGYDVRIPGDMMKIRRMIGICPQHNINFPLLTTEEHLYFYSRLRGIPDNNLAETVKKMLEEVDLVQQASLRSSKLSGGQLRKLSIAIALIGDPKLIFLDEPTAGVSLESRGKLWSLLKRKKVGKVILMTTHFMDEADVLSDRKVIMSKGTIKCGGSSLFLKNRFGLGYNLTITLKEEADEPTLTEKVKTKISCISLERKQASEVTYLIPPNATSELSNLCEFLEGCIASENSLGVDCYSISITSLEQVFLRLDENFSEQDIKAKNFDGRLPRDSTAPEPQSTSLRNFSDTLDIKKSFWKSFSALFKVRFLDIIREPVAIIFTVFVPILIIILSMHFSTGDSDSGQRFEALLLNADLYSDKANDVAIYNGTGGSLEYLHPVFSQMGLVMSQYNGSYQYLADNPPHFSALDLYQSPMGLVEPQNRRHSPTTIYFNASFAHTLPIALNLWSNMYLGATIPNVTDKDLIHVSTENLPLHLNHTGVDSSSTVAPSFLGIVFVMVPSILVLSIVQDREMGIRNLLRLNGVSFSVYFLSFFSSMSIYYVLSYISLLTIIAIYQIPSVIIPAALMTVALCYLLYMPFALVSNAFFSYIFNKYATAKTFYPGLSITIGAICYYIVMVTDVLLYRDMSLRLHYLFVVFVPFYIPFGLLFKINSIYLICTLAGTCTELTISDYTQPEILVIYVTCTFGTIFWLILLRWADMWSGNSVRCWKKANTSGLIFPVTENNTNLSDDAFDEKKKAYDGLLETSNVPTIVAYDVEQTYNKRTLSSFFGKARHKKLPKTLQGVSLVVEEGNIFGLLGPNGAGKTTFMRVLTGEATPSQGMVKVCGENVASKSSSAFEHMGYCPQHDCLWKNISVEEHIECYAAIGGVGEMSSRLKEIFIDGLHIKDHIKKKTTDISGGTKRKLSFIMSMIGSPKLLLLDEPSTGLDPASKRHLWDVILLTVSGNRSAILTTHSMEETEALCSRIGIMIGGSFRVIGSSQKLKDRFGFGYIVEAKLRQRDDDSKQAQMQLEHAVKNKFENSSIRESFGDILKISVPCQKISELFLFFEALKINSVIEDYTVDQKSLEEMFIALTMSQEQIDADRKARENNQSLD